MLNLGDKIKYHYDKKGLLIDGTPSGNSFKVEDEFYVKKITREEYLVLDEVHINIFYLLSNHNGVILIVSQEAIDATR